METPLPFQRLFEESPDILLVLLPDAPRFTAVAATKARLRVTLTTLEQTVGHGLFELFPDNPDDPEATGTMNLRASLMRVLETRAADTMAVQKYDIRDPDGTYHARYWSPKNIPVLDRDGRVEFIFHRVEDVTDLVRASEAGEELMGRTRQMEREVVARSQELAAANAQLRDANTRLGELDATKTAFFNNVSHEFRTPLTLMLGPLEDLLMPGAAVPEPARAPLRLVHDNALRLLTLVNTLLDFSRLEVGRLQAAFGPVDLPAVTATLAGVFQSAAERAGLSLIVDCPPPAGPTWVDRELWEKVVLNVIANAVKFTAAGSITVRVREAAPWVVTEVIDTGIGIEAADLPHIFERFYRAPGTGRTHEGTGIGLSLVKALVELHGGSVTAASTVGVGTTLRLALPMGTAHLPASTVSMSPLEPHQTRTAAAFAAEALRWVDGARRHAAAPRDPSAADATRSHVLVVDDNPDLRAYVSDLLAPHYEVTSAVDGEDALAQIRTALPDLIVSDVMMPRLDGVGLVRALRNHPETAAVPVILLSARAGEESTIEGLASGCDDYVVKPFVARELLARVHTHVELARMRRRFIVTLERANRELDAFSYSVSHDLKAPLRAIDGYSRALAEQYDDRLDDEARGHIGQVRDGVARMTTLIDAFLGLARLGRAALHVEPVDLSAMAAEISADLRRSQPGRRVQISIAPGLEATADRPLMHVVLANLLGNAWKFTSQRANATIAVGQTEATTPTFFVRDNGAGFNMADAERLFAPFRRLHPSRDFPGTGIGLASVERIIHRHGGDVWAEAAPDSGATFFFTLPQDSATR